MLLCHIISRSVMGCDLPAEIASQNLERPPWTAWYASDQYVNQYLLFTFLFMSNNFSQQMSLISLCTAPWSLRQNLRGSPHPSCQCPVDTILSRSYSFSGFHNLSATYKMDMGNQGGWRWGGQVQGDRHVDQHTSGAFPRAPSQLHLTRH